MDSTAHFWTSDLICCIVVQDDSCSRSCWRMLRSSSVTISLYTTQSSANSWKWDLMLFWMSFIKRRKRDGPMTGSWGDRTRHPSRKTGGHQQTQTITCVKEKPLSSWVCRLELRSAGALMPRRPWDTLSNAVWKPKKMASTCLMLQEDEGPVINSWILLDRSEKNLEETLLGVSRDIIACQMFGNGGLCAPLSCRHCRCWRSASSLTYHSSHPTCELSRRDYCWRRSNLACYSHPLLSWQQMELIMKNVLEVITVSVTCKKAYIRTLNILETFDDWW